MIQKTMLSLALAASGFASPAHANDSSAAIGIGGLELKQSDAISMDSEDLYLSRQKVTVKYRFTNTSNRDVETMVSFPLPALPNAMDGYIDVASFTDWREQLQFKTLVNGKPVELGYHEAVILSDRAGPKDLSAKIKALGWPVRYWDDYEFDLYCQIERCGKSKAGCRRLAAKRSGQRLLLAQLADTGACHPQTDLPRWQDDQRRAQLQTDCRR
jgi:hypothetical protein